MGVDIFVLQEAKYYNSLTLPIVKAFNVKSPRGNFLFVSRFDGQTLINNDDIQLVNINVKPNKELLILNVHNRNFNKDK